MTRERHGRTEMGIKPLPKRSSKLASRNVFSFSAVTFHFERLSWEHLPQWTSHLDWHMLRACEAFHRQTETETQWLHTAVGNNSRRVETLFVSLQFFSACSWKKWRSEQRIIIILATTQDAPDPSGEAGGDGRLIRCHWALPILVVAGMDGLTNNYTFICLIV